MRKKGPDFLGIGAQKAGTSWIYACLREHPQIFFPMKEVHFFSRDRNWRKGYDWYESLFAKYPKNAVAGEYSTSYLYHEKTPERIAARYPGVKLIVSLRNPIDRAFSNYINDIKAGEISRNTSFRKALDEHPEYIEQGMYSKQIRRYLDSFSCERLLVLKYDDCHDDPQGFIQRIFSFLEVDRSYNPGMLERRINTGQVPNSFLLNRMIRGCGVLLNKTGFEKVGWAIRRSGLPQKIRTWNSSKSVPGGSLSDEDRVKLYSQFSDDIKELEEMVGQEFHAWEQ